MSEIKEEKTLRQYIVKEKYLKDQLGILGNIDSMGLHSGLSPNDEKAGISHDDITWEIRTSQSSTEEAT